MVPKDSFLLEEYKALRQEILLKLQHEFDIQKNTMIGVAVVYTAAFTLHRAGINPSDYEAIEKLIWYLPPLMVFVGGFFTEFTISYFRAWVCT